MLRKLKREMLKRELGTNNISEEFHKRYGYTPNVNKNKMKLLERLKKKLRKIGFKRARRNKLNNN